jgi:cyanophycinase-like exopeptidase
MFSALQTLRLLREVPARREEVSYPKLLGIGIDEKAALVVDGDRFEVIGEGRVAVYDNKKHGGSWWYSLKPGDRFDLRTRTVQK